MTVIGITGPTGAGKTTALSVLKEMGVQIIDCDSVYHRLLDSSKEMVSEIKEKFPNAVNDGKVDRKKLGQEVFANPIGLEMLNIITHRFMGAEINRIINNARAAGEKAAAIDAIALIESGLSGLCDIVLAVLAPLETRIQRIIDREGIAAEYARLRTKAQPADEFYIANTSHVIVNDFENPDDFRKKCREYFQTII